MNRIKLSAKLLVIAFVLVLFPLQSMASDWPSKKPINLICPYSAGGDGDLSARLWADFAEKKIGQSILVVNKTGGGGVTGTTFAAQSKADGYTLFLAQAGPILITPNVANTRYNYDSFDYVARINVGNCALIINSKDSWNTLEEFIADAKANPNKYSFASPGATTWLSFAMREFIQEAGIQVKHVEFQGSAPAVTSVLGGHTTFTFCFPQNYVNQVRSGALKALAVGDVSEDLPNVKTFEAQGFPGAYYGWAGIAAPKGVPAEIRQKIAQVTSEIVQDPDFIEKSKNIYATPSFLDEKAWEPILNEQHTVLLKLLDNIGLRKK